jgi:general secretion pathway protein H
MRSRGFSLVEMVIVLVLISLSVALVVPSLSRFSNRIELKSAAQKVSSILRYFRSESIQKGKVYQILFDPELREVRVQVLAEEGEAEKGREEPGVYQKSYLLPRGIRMKEVKILGSEFPSDLPAIEFYPDGGSNGGSILLDGQDRKGYRIKVHFLTGLVDIEEV